MHLEVNKEVARNVALEEDVHLSEKEVRDVIEIEEEDDVNLNEEEVKPTKGMGFLSGVEFATHCHHYAYKKTVRVFC